MVKRLKRTLMERYKWTVAVINEEPFFETLDLIALDIEDEATEQEEVFVDEIGWW